MVEETEIFRTCTFFLLHSWKGMTYFTLFSQLPKSGNLINQVTQNSLPKSLKWRINTSDTILNFAKYNILPIA